MKRLPLLCLLALAGVVLPARVAAAVPPGWGWVVGGRAWTPAFGPPLFPGSPFAFQPLGGLMPFSAALGTYNPLRVWPYYWTSPSGSPVVMSTGMWYGDAHFGSGAPAPAVPAAPAARPTAPPVVERTPEQRLPGGPPFYLEPPVRVPNQPAAAEKAAAPAVQVELLETGLYLVRWLPGSQRPARVELRSLGAEDVELDFRQAKEPPYRLLLRVPPETRAVTLRVIDVEGKSETQRWRAAEFRALERGRAP